MGDQKFGPREAWHEREKRLYTQGYYAQGSHHSDEELVQIIDTVPYDNQRPGKDWPWDLTREEMRASLSAMESYFADKFYDQEDTYRFLRNLAHDPDALEATINVWASSRLTAARHAQSHRALPSVSMGGSFDPAEEALDQAIIQAEGRLTASEKDYVSMEEQRIRAVLGTELSVERRPAALSAVASGKRDVNVADGTAQNL